jgi:hypothetical protein
MLYLIRIKSAKRWELPKQKSRKKTEKSKNHLSKTIYCIFVSVLHSNWGSKNTKFGNLKKEIKSKSMILKR